MSQQENGKWKVAFIPPNLYDLMRDFIFTKGDKEHVYSPKILVIRAVEEYLDRKGYQTQVAEIKDALKQQRNPRIFSLEKLSDEQKDVVRVLVKYREMSEQEAIKWVLDHPEEVKESLVESV